jgi:glutaredoxin
MQSHTPPTSFNRWKRIFQLVAMCLSAVLFFSVLNTWQANRGTQDLALHVKPGDLQMISSLTCTYCTQAQRWFKKHQLPFSECFVEKDPACAKAYLDLRTPGTPVIFIKGQKILGFDPNEITKILKSPLIQVTP